MHWLWNLVTKLCTAWWSIIMLSSHTYVVSDRSQVLKILEWRVKIQLQDSILASPCFLLMIEAYGHYALLTCTINKICVKQMFLVSCLCLLQNSHWPNLLVSKLESSCSYILVCLHVTREQLACYTWTACMLHVNSLQVTVLAKFNRNTWVWWTWVPS